MNSRVIWRTHTTLVAPFKAAGTSDILIHAVIPAAVRYNDRTRNQKHIAALCPDIGFQYQKLKRIDGDCRLLNAMSINLIWNQETFFSLIKLLFTPLSTNDQTTSLQRCLHYFLWVKSLKYFALINEILKFPMCSWDASGALTSFITKQCIFKLFSSSSRDKYTALNSPNGSSFWWSKDRKNFPGSEQDFSGFHRTDSWLCNLSHVYTSKSSLMWLERNPGV